MLKVKYKCRLCEATFHLDTDFTGCSKWEMAYSANTGKPTSIGITIFQVESHDCDGNNVGIADMLGIANLSD